MVRVLIFTGCLAFASAVSAQQRCTPDAWRVVDDIYQQVLGRSADSGSAAGVKKLESGYATVRELVRDIAASPEYDRRFFLANPNNSAANEGIVADLYERLLNRPPSQADQRAYARLAAERGLAPVVNDIVSSAEYQRVNGDWKVPGNAGRSFCAQGSQAAQPGDRGDGTRFRGMDRNNDGIITQQEWRGSAQSFRVHDWNGDRVLSGDEIRAGGAQRGSSVEDGDFDRADRFDDLDVDRDGRIEWREWHGTVDAFKSLDRNNDNVLTQSELRGTAGAVATSGRVIIVPATVRWVDTGINLRAGDTVHLDATGTIELGSSARDTATPDGAPTGWFAPQAPVRNRVSGGLVARMGDSAPVFVGAHNSIQVSTSGRLYLTNNDDYLGDNAGEFRVTIDVSSQ